MDNTKQKPKVGRPQSVSETRWQPRKASESDGEDQLEIPAFGERAASSAATGGHDSGNDDDDAAVSMKRTDWSKGGHRIKMEQAVFDWSNKTGLCTEDMSIKKFAKAVCIPRATLQSRIHSDPEKRVDFDTALGRPSLVKPGVQRHIVDVLKCRDRGNSALTPREAVDLVLEVTSGINRKQAEHTFRRTIRVNHSDELTGIFKPTTAKRAAIAFRNNEEKCLKKTSTTANIEKSALAAAVKLQDKSMDVSKLAMPEMRALALYYFKTDLLEGKKGAVMHAFAQLMEQHPGVALAISAVRVAPSAAAEREHGD